MRTFGNRLVNDTPQVRQVKQHQNSRRHQRNENQQDPCPGNVHGEIITTASLKRNSADGSAQRMFRNANGNTGLAEGTVLSVNDTADRPGARPVELHANLLHDTDGSLIVWLGSTIDSAERRHFPLFYENAST